MPNLTQAAVLFFSLLSTALADYKCTCNGVMNSSVSACSDAIKTVADMEAGGVKFANHWALSDHDSYCHFSGPGRPETSAIWFAFNQPCGEKATCS